MKQNLLNRRQFLRQTGYACAGATLLSSSLRTQAAEGKDLWSIGCFNRPWDAFSYDQALKGLAQAGFETTGLVGNHRSSPEPLLSVDATPEYLKRLKDRIHASGLSPIIAWISGPKARDHAGAVVELKQLIDNAARLGLPSLLSGGPRRNETVEAYSKTMAEVMPYAADQGLKIAMKPHGVDSPEVLECVERVKHSHFSLWYDAGNMIHYTGEDPVKALHPLAPHVTGFCAKDCAEKGGEVTLQFGDGKVDFAGVFRVLKKAGFQGPIMIDCTGRGATPDEVTRLAIRNREFLRNAFARS